MLRTYDKHLFPNSLITTKIDTNKKPEISITFLTTIGFYINVVMLASVKKFIILNFNIFILN